MFSSLRNRRPLTTDADVRDSDSSRSLLPLRSTLVVDDGNVTRNEFCRTQLGSHRKPRPKEPGRRRRTVFQNAPIGQINPAPFVSDDNDCPTEGDVPAEPHVAGDGEMVELKDGGYGAETLLEISNLLKRVAELYNGRLIEHPVRVHHELAVLQTIEIRGDQEEVGCGFNLCDVEVCIC